MIFAQIGVVNIDSSSTKSTGLIILDSPARHSSIEYKGMEFPKNENHERMINWTTRIAYLGTPVMLIYSQGISGLSQQGRFLHECCNSRSTHVYVYTCDTAKRRLYCLSLETIVNTSSATAKMTAEGFSILSIARQHKHIADTRKHVSGSQQFNHRIMR
jgi:phage protein U